MTGRRIVLAALALAFVLVAGPARALVQESLIEVEVAVKDRKGEAVRQKIPVVVFRESTRARSPFLVLGHGRAPTKEARTKPGRVRYSDNARYFVSLGYTVFVPTRIGYMSAGGPDVEDTGACKSKNYPRGYEVGAEQTLQVIDYAKSLPYIDAKHGLVVGQSFGGTLSVTLAAKNVPGVMGFVNFAGGGGGNPTDHPGEPCQPEKLTKMFGDYGRTARAPTLWLYAENDRYMGNVYPRQWFDAFKAKGGKGEFVRLPAHGADGHPSFSSNPSAWKPAFEAFLKKL